MSQLTVRQAGEALRAGRLSALELAEDHLRRIEAGNPRLNAFLTVTAETARAAARQADEELRAGHDRGPLHGIPLAHKDLIPTAGIRTTFGSKIFAESVPDTDAAIVESLREAGAVLVGKTHLHEFAYGITSNNPHFGPVRNPWDTDRIPGGSSGGAGAALAANMTMLATGTDTGGSIRVPASYCGVVGLKPTYGLVSKHGIFPLGFSLDHPGPMGRTVEDVALMLEAMTGYDARDAASVNRPRESYSIEGASLSGLKIVLPQNFYFDKIDPEVRALILAAAQQAESGGATFVMGRVPDGEQLNAVAQAILLAEAATVHEPYLRKRRADYGAAVLSLLDMGRALPATHYLQAQRLRKRILTVYLELLKKADCILTPATPITAPPIGAETVDVGGELHDVRILTTRCSRGINALGLPALVIPCGWTSAGLPAGLQLIGRPFGEAALLRAGAALEAAIGFQPREWKP
jgi:aspartyl-tRNA(Asn)/glutamyl-tRNA(Gln) amidotransferase subunit A